MINFMQWLESTTPRYQEFINKLQSAYHAVIDACENVKTTRNLYDIANATSSLLTIVVNAPTDEKQQYAALGLHDLDFKSIIASRAHNASMTLHKLSERIKKTKQFNQLSQQNTQYDRSSGYDMTHQIPATKENNDLVKIMTQIDKDSDQLYKLANRLTAATT